MKTVTAVWAEDIFKEAQETPLNVNYVSRGLARNIEELQETCHTIAAAAGWWHKKSEDVNHQGHAIYQLRERNVGEAIALMHSELSEALEGARKDLLSDKIPEFTSLEEELADTLIRIFDFAGGANLRLGDAFVAKLWYNLEREDHSLRHREAPGGKDF